MQGGSRDESVIRDRAHRSRLVIHAAYAARVSCSLFCTRQKSRIWPFAFSLPRRNATVRTTDASGIRKQFARSAHGTRSRSETLRRSGPNRLRDQAGGSACATTYRASTGAPGRRSGIADSYRKTWSGPRRDLDSKANRHHIRSEANPSRAVTFCFDIFLLRDFSNNLVKR